MILVLNMLLPATAGLLLLLWEMGGRTDSLMLAYASSGDEDMKIAGGSFTSGAPGAEDISEAEAAARAYMRQKDSGNVDRARALGEQLAGALEATATELARKLSDPESQAAGSLLRMHHQFLLFSYAVNRVIADLSPNSILAQTALNVFYSKLETAPYRLDEHVRDMAALSLYILCERSESRLEDEIGIIYARLCGAEGKASMIEEGNRLYLEYYAECARLHKQTNYSQV